MEGWIYKCSSAPFKSGHYKAQAYLKHSRVKKAKIENAVSLYRHHLRKYVVCVCVCVCVPVCLCVCVPVCLCLQLTDEDRDFVTRLALNGKMSSGGGS